jgi:hypothetical protein
MAKTKLTANAEIDVLNRAELEHVLANWRTELARGVKLRRHAILGTVAADGTLEMGENSDGPAEGMAWAITRVSVTGAPTQTTVIEEATATGDIQAGPVNLRSVTLSSALAGSGPGKLEIRDGAAGTVLMTLTVAQDATALWTSSDEVGIPFSTTIHATISGLGPGIVASFEYDVNTIGGLDIFANSADSSASLLLAGVSGNVFPGDHGCNLLSGDSLRIAGSGLTPDQHVTVTLSIKEVPSAMAWNL